MLLVWHSNKPNKPMPRTQHVDFVTSRNRVTSSSSSTLKKFVHWIKAHVASSTPVLERCSFDSFHILMTHLNICFTSLLEYSMAGWLDLLQQNKPNPANYFPLPKKLRIAINTLTWDKKKINTFCFTSSSPPRPFRSTVSSKLIFLLRVLPQVNPEWASDDDVAGWFPYNFRNHGQLPSNPVRISFPPKPATTKCPIRRRNSIPFSAHFPPNLSSLIYVHWFPEINCCSPQWGRFSWNARGLSKIPTFSRLSWNLEIADTFSTARGNDNVKMSLNLTAHRAGIGTKMRWENLKWAEFGNSLTSDGLSTIT